MHYSYVYIYICIIVCVVQKKTQPPSTTSAPWRLEDPLWRPHGSEISVHPTFYMFVY